MKVAIDNINCTLIKSTSKERDFMDETLSFWVKGAEFSDAYRKGYWDGYRHLYRSGTRTFLSGLLPLVIQACDGGNVRINVVDRRRRPKTDSISFGTSEWVALLEDSGFKDVSVSRCRLQVNGVKNIIRKRLGGSSVPVRWSRGIVQLPTGTGKTILAAALIQRFYDLPSLFLVDRKDPLWQTKEVFEQIFKERIGVIGDGRMDIQHHTVATVQTVSRAIKANSRQFRKYLDSIRLLVVDECHKVANNDYLKVLRKIPAYYRIGLSATPLEKDSVDGLYLIGALGDVIYELSSQDAVAKGYLAKPIVRFIDIRDPVIDTRPIYTGDVKQRQQAARENYQEVYKLGIIDNESRNRRIVRCVRKAFKLARPTMVLVRSLRHGYVLTKLLQKALPDARVGYLKGRDKSIHRRRTTKDFKRGRLDVLVASTIFDEAVDIPNIRTLVLAGGGRSPIKAIQRVGRGMRRKEGRDNTLRVIDFLDRTHKYLLEHSLERLKIYERKGYTIKAKYVDTGV
jgi:superfamily II DNA or RNA helicase